VRWQASPAWYSRPVGLVHSVNTPWHVRLIFDYIQTMVDGDRFAGASVELTGASSTTTQDVRPKRRVPAVPWPRTGQPVRAWRSSPTPIRICSCATHSLLPRLDVVKVSR
jgi:hypothetical protein